MPHFSKLTLPPLETPVINHSIGLIRHVLDIGGEYEVVHVEDFYTSPKVKEKIYTLSDGQKIIVTKKKKLPLTNNVDGVLRSEGKIQKWLAHKKLEAMKNNIQHQGLPNIAKNISDSWHERFNYRTEARNEKGEVIRKGLRPPQIGGLHAIAAHWSLYHQPATIIMPTGTGKTETMLATLIAHNQNSFLIVVPSKILRDQTAKKFLTLGLLRALGNIPPDTKNPIVGIIKKRPLKEADLDIFTKCNVVVATMSVLGEESSKKVSALIANYSNVLIVDEAHHIAARSWSTFRENFSTNKVLQFTATPYRRDGKLVDGKIIFEYPLSSAQKDGYFKKISFEPVYEIEQNNADNAIAASSVRFLLKDIEAGWDHLMMARCDSIERAEAVHKIYSMISPELNPILIHSESSHTKFALEQIQSRKSRIIVCVNMLGEGFDLPQLKIAAVHDTHKSLAILLQFTGRFTRSSGEAIGNATVIANIADQNVSTALERLYAEDADWNQLLSELSSEAAKSHAELIQFLNSSKELNPSDDEDKIEISHHLLNPTFSTLMYESKSFIPNKFFEGLPKGTTVYRAWFHEDSNTIYFVTKAEPPIRWTRSRKLKDKIWNLHVFHYDQVNNLLFVSSSDKSTTHDKIAESLGATQLISGDIIFRTLARINRLIFQNVGVRKHGRRNLRYAMYTGSDVAEALTISERAGSVKSNLSGTGWEDGQPATIGCSYKGRVWTRHMGPIPKLIAWCESIGKKIRDDTINTKQIIANVLIPEEIETLPDKQILCIEWPVEILKQSDERVVLKKGAIEKPISMLDLQWTISEPSKNEVHFCISSSKDDIWVTLILRIGGAEGFKVIKNSDETVSIQIGNLKQPIEEYLSSYPPMIRFIDMSELDGNLLIKPQNTQELVYPEERFEVWNWVGVNIHKESIWKDGSERQDSIQWHVSQHYIELNFDIVFDDDGPGEAADLICLKEEDDCIRLALLHCKFTEGKTSGERVKDVVEVSSQAIRSAKWRWKFKDLCEHILKREQRLTVTRSTRFLKGKMPDIGNLIKVSRNKQIKLEIIIIQPGLSKSKHTPDQTAVLAAAHSYLKETVGINLDVICNE